MDSTNRLEACESIRIFPALVSQVYGADRLLVSPFSIRHKALVSLVYGAGRLLEQSLF